MSIPLLCCPFSKQAHLPLMFICFLLPSLLTLLLYALPTVWSVIVILPHICSRSCFYLWTLKRSPSSTSLPRAICTAWSQIIFSLYPLGHNSLNVIFTKWWSSITILSLSFVRFSWTCIVNNSWWLICNPYYSRLCTISQQYFHCEWKISSIPTTIPAAHPSAVLR